MPPIGWATRLIGVQALAPITILLPKRWVSMRSTTGSWATWLSARLYKKPPRQSVRTERIRDRMVRTDPWVKKPSVIHASRSTPVRVLEGDRKGLVEGKKVSGRVDLGGCRFLKK